MKILTVVGARPQFVKAAVFSRVVVRWNKENPSEPVNEVILHTGQHYDDNMSDVFFTELGIPEPRYNLSIGGGSHGAATGAMLAKIEQIIMEERPDWVLVYGDTNSTLAGALAASKLHFKIAHVEAGLRSYNKIMPEEINRVLTDHVSTLLFCPTKNSVNNLAKEGIFDGVENVGDIMYDASLFYSGRAKDESDVIQRLGLDGDLYILVTCHRAENTDDPDRLVEILEALSELSTTYKVVFPMHPRTREAVRKYKVEHLLANISLVEPVPFLDMIVLTKNAHCVVTDSGGLQKEAYFFQVPCITLRDETEWNETIEVGANRLAGANKNKIVEFVTTKRESSSWPSLYGAGDTGEQILSILRKNT